MLRQGTAIDATLIVVPSSTKNSGGERDPEMHQTRKVNEWHFGMKANVGGVDSDSCLMQLVTTTAASQHDVTQASKLMYDAEMDVFADLGYRGVE